MVSGRPSTSDFRRPDLQSAGRRRPGVVARRQPRDWAARCRRQHASSPPTSSPSASEFEGRVGSLGAHSDHLRHAATSNHATGISNAGLSRLRHPPVCPAKPKLSATTTVGKDTYSGGLRARSRRQKKSNASAALTAAYSMPAPWAQPLRSAERYKLQLNYQCLCCYVYDE